MSFKMIFQFGFVYSLDAFENFFDALPPPRWSFKKEDRDWKGESGRIVPN